MRFEWDDEKNRINSGSTAASRLETAALVFNDPLTLFRKDRVVEGEQRWHATSAAKAAQQLSKRIRPGRCAAGCPCGPAGSGDFLPRPIQNEAGGVAVLLVVHVYQDIVKNT